MTPEKQAAIEEALEEFGREEGVKEISVVLQNRNLLPEALREDLELAAGIVSTHDPGHDPSAGQQHSNDDHKHSP